MKNLTSAKVSITEKYRELTVHMDALKTFEPVIQMFPRTSMSVFGSTESALKPG
jgi:hypothetical protein